ncbi:pentapeptide repeat-containing protein [Nakamurella sp. GG22]
MRRDLRGLSKEGADWVAAHLVAAGALADDEPELAWRHARAARARGGRIGVVRETVGLVAYRAGEWAEAIGELRAARRMGGGPGQLAVMADCERALGHPERAIELSRSAEADALDPESATELSIVVAGARADLGQVDTAIAQMERVGLEKLESNPRLAYAYADLLLKNGRQQDALSWFIKAADADLEEETDALERVEELGAEVPSAESPDASEPDDDVAEGAGLEHAHPKGADLEGADLEGADLEGADLEGADLESADLEGADLEGADPEGADLESADAGADGAEPVDGNPSDEPAVIVVETVQEATDPDHETMADSQDDTDPGGVDVDNAVAVADVDAATKDESAVAAEEVTVEEPGAAEPIVPTVLFSDDPQTGDR